MSTQNFRIWSYLKICGCDYLTGGHPGLEWALSPMAHREDGGREGSGAASSQGPPGPTKSWKRQEQSLLQQEHDSISTLLLACSPPELWDSNAMLSHLFLALCCGRHGKLSSFPFNIQRHEAYTCGWTTCILCSLHSRQHGFFICIFLWNVFF